MNKIHKWIIFLSVFLLTVNGVFYTALADHNDHKKTRKHHKSDRVK